MSLQWMRDRVGGTWPNLVLSLDVETTGCVPGRDHVWQIGYALMRDGRVVKSGDIVLNLYASSFLYGPALDMAVRDIRTRMESKGHRFDITPARLKAGQPPKTVYKAIADLCHRTLAAGGWVTGFNFVKFDRNFLMKCAKQYDVDFPDVRCLDAMVVDRVARFGKDPKYMPRSGEILDDYQSRVASFRVVGTLVATVQRLGLSNMPGCSLGSAHDAAVDATYAAGVLMHYFKGGAAMGCPAAAKSEDTPTTAPVVMSPPPARPSLPRPAIPAVAVGERQRCSWQ